MKVAILSRDPSLYSTRRLLEAARARGHAAAVLDYGRCGLVVGPGGPAAHHRGQGLTPPDVPEVVVPRIAPRRTQLGTAVVRQLEWLGARSVNPARAIRASRDKLRCLQLLAQAGLAVPATAFIGSAKDLPAAVEAVGGYPVVLKIIEGTQGIGVVLAENRTAAKGVFEAFAGLRANVLVQEFIAEAGGGDVRAIVAGGAVVAAMARQAPPGDFRANLHAGGAAASAALTADEAALAVTATAVLGLGVAGVDLLRSRRGPLVLELNSSPGLEGVEGATGLDVAGAVIETACRPPGP